MSLRIGYQYVRCALCCASCLHRDDHHGDVGVEEETVSDSGVEEAGEDVFLFIGHRDEVDVAFGCNTREVRVDRRY